MSRSSQQAQQPSSADSVAVASGVLVDIVVLAADVELFASVREAVGERNPVWRARSADEAADLLITGHGGVLLIDMATISARPDSLIVQVAEQFPDLVICVAGRRDDEPLLAPLISDGLVYRFMHKPLTARRAGMFLQAAIRHHVERRAGLASADHLPRFMRRMARPPASLRWLYLVTALLSVGIVAGYIASGYTAKTKPVAPPASPLSTPVDPGVVAVPRANPVLSRARAALAAGRLEAPAGRNALDLFQSVLLAQPGHAEAREGLAATVDGIFAQARRQVDAGERAEAVRLLRRLLAAEPAHAEAQVLAGQLDPPATPSRHLAEEQVGDALRAAAARTADAIQPVATATVAPAPRMTDAPAPALSPAPVPQVATREARVIPDPLAPRYTNSGRGTKVNRTAGVYGARPAQQLEIAGYERPTAAVSASVPARPVGGIVPVAAPLTRTDVVAADEFERVDARDPVYPAQALRERTEGWVELEFTITAGGTVRDIAIIDAHPGGVFERAATDALAEWQFRPRYVNGQPVAQRSTLRIRFDVDG